MTINIKVEVSAPTGFALEVIEADQGVETFRRRVEKSDLLGVWGSKTLILREVSEAEAVAPAPGGRRHGSLEAAAREMDRNLRSSAMVADDVGALRDALDKEILRADNLRAQLDTAAARIDELKTELQKIADGAPAPGPHRLAAIARIAEHLSDLLEEADAIDDAVLTSSLQSIVDVCTLPIDQLPADMFPRTGAAADKAGA